jgi:enterochelin esterase family protein
MRTPFILIPLAALCAQQPPVVPTVISPDVHADRTVSFRLYAPKASEAAFFGDWMKAGTSEKMTKGPDGVWSLTVGPVRPGI